MAGCIESKLGQNIGITERRKGLAPQYVTGWTEVEQALVVRYGTNGPLIPRPGKADQGRAIGLQMNGRIAFWIKRIVQRKIHGLGPQRIQCRSQADRFELPAIDYPGRQETAIGQLPEIAIHGLEGAQSVKLQVLVNPYPEVLPAVPRPNDQCLSVRQRIDFGVSPIMLQQRILVGQQIAQSADFV